MKFFRTLALAFVVSLLCAGALLYEVSRPYAGFSGETFVDLPKGTGFADMAHNLEHAGVIRHAWEFVILRALHPVRGLKAGEYRFAQPATVVEVYDRIARGDLFFHTLTVHEGDNMFDIAAAAARLKLFPAADFLGVARDPSLIRDLDPQAPTLEGYLFPSTYHVPRRTMPEELCRMMTNRFRSVWKQLGQPADPHAVVTMASLIEREARISGDRPLISSVFHNRLAKGMKLDCDPTTIYAAILDGRYQGTIHQSDLASQNPYNTYRHNGLPPGPISNPGKESLEAAIHPAQTDYLYFVLRPDGSNSHSFSATMAEHAANTAKYRRANQPPQVDKGSPRRTSRAKRS